MSDEEDTGQSLVAYLGEIKRSPPRPTPYESRRREIELHPYEAPVPDCAATTRQGEPCKRPADPRTGYCPSHEHLSDRAARRRPLPPMDVEAAVERRAQRDAIDNPPSLHLILKRVRSMIDAERNGDRAALRDSLVDIAAAAKNAAEEMAPHAVEAPVSHERAAIS